MANRQTYRGSTFHGPGGARDRAAIHYLHTRASGAFTSWDHEAVPVDAIVYHLGRWVSRHRSAVGAKLVANAGGYPGRIAGDSSSEHQRNGIAHITGAQCLRNIPTRATRTTGHSGTVI